MSRRWCFTVNNYTADDEELFRTLPCKYLICGKEVGEQGTPHLQGYLILEKNARLSACKKIHAGAHWEIASGTTSHNVTYCSKGGDFWELGARPSDDGRAGGARGGDAEKARWDAAKTAALEGRIDDVPSDIYVRYYRTLKEIAKDHMQKQPDADDVTGVWLYGPPGSGKSRTARERYPDAYPKMQNKWWDGYQGEPFVILDDLDSDTLGHHLKIWGDRYSFTAETKGGAINIRPKVICVTSNYTPRDLWGHDPSMLAAIERRFTLENIL